MPHRFLPAIALLFIAVVSLGAVACDSDDDAPAATATSPATIPPDATPEPTALPFQGSREPVEVISDVVPTPILVDVRAASHEDFDRVVFEFADSRPGYRVEYVDEAVACGSGLEVEVVGTAILQVRMQPAAAHNEAGHPTFTKQRSDSELASVLEVIQTCDFEGEVTWAVGLTQEADFVVSALPDPFRIVVDLAHPS